MSTEELGEEERRGGEGEDGRRERTRCEEEEKEKRKQKREDKSSDVALFLLSNGKTLPRQCVLDEARVDGQGYSIVQKGRESPFWFLFLLTIHHSEWFFFLC